MDERQGRQRMLTTRFGKRQRRREVKKKEMRNLQKPVDLGSDTLCDFMVNSREEEEELPGERRRKWWLVASSKEQLALPLTSSPLGLFYHLKFEIKSTKKYFVKRAPWLVSPTFGLLFARFCTGTGYEIPQPVTHSTADKFLIALKPGYSTVSYLDLRPLYRLVTKCLKRSFWVVRRPDTGQ